MPRKIIGLDTGSSSLKIVEIEKSLRGFAITRAASIKGNASNGELPGMIEQIMGDGADVDNEVWASLPLKDVTSRIITVPFTGDAKIEKVLPFEIESNGPFEAEDMIVDHQPIEKTGNSTKILAAGVKRDAVESRIGLLGAAGLNPIAIVPEGFAFRSIINISSDKSDSPTAHLDIGARHSILTVGIGGKAVASRSIPIGGDRVTELIATRYALSFDDAEKLKLSGKLLESDMSKIVAEALQPLGAQIENALRFLRAEENLPVGKIRLAGGASKTPRLAEIISEMTGVECSPIELPPAAGNPMGPEFASALALALENVNPVKGLNFRKDEYAYKSERTVLREKAFFPAVLIFLIALSLSVGAMIKNTSKKRELSQVKAQSASVVETVFPGENLTPKQALQTMSEKLTRIKKLEESMGQLTGVSPLQVMTAVSTLIPPDLNVDMESIDIKQETVTLKGLITQHPDMDVLVEKLKGFDAFKKFDPPELKQKVGSSLIEFTLRIHLLDENAEKKEETP